jgi:hypothetical protein
MYCSGELEMDFSSSTSNYRALIGLGEDRMVAPLLGWLTYLTLQRLRHCWHRKRKEEKGETESTGYLEQADEDDQKKKQQETEEGLYRAKHKGTQTGLGLTGNTQPTPARPRG